MSKWNDASKKKPLSRWDDAFGNVFQSAHGCFGRPKVWYGCSPKLNLLAKWEYEIVSKRISELPFFLTYAFVRTFENEQISSNVHFFGWVSLTRLKFNTSFFLKLQNRHRLFNWLVMSQVTDSMCKYAHNSYFNNWSGDNASNKITCSLWDTSCILESLFWDFGFFWTKSKSRIRTFFLTKCRRKTKFLFFGRKAKSRCFGLGWLFPK